MSADCVETELLLAAGVLAGADEPAAALRAHLEGCELCARLARELDNPVVADALDEAAEAATDLPELTVVPAEHYRRGKEIGRGGMGRIVRARDRRLGRAVAIKELLDERLRARFEREARLTARLQHPAIVSVHEVGRWPDGGPFYAMKYVAGRPLDAVIAGRHTLAERLALLPNLVTVVEAIAYAHSERVIHRDLKPANILIGPFGETVVIDWGLAKEIGSADGVEPAAPFRDDGMAITRAGAGTPAYMPPEQARGEAPDERVDVFALGATLRQLISGEPPRREPRPLPTETPAELGAIVAKAMAEDRAARYPTARELADELIRFQSGQLVGAHRYSMRQLAGRWLRRHRSMVALAAAFAVALAGTGAFSVARIVAARRDAESERDGANRAYAELLVERGRQELAIGTPARALAYLREALARGVDTPVVRYLIAEARRSTAPLILSSDDGGRLVDAAALDGAGTTLALLDRAGNISLVDVASGRTRHELLADGGVQGFRFDEAGGARLVTWSHEPAARVWDVASGRLLFMLPTEAQVEGARFHPDGRLLTWSGRHATLWSAGGQRLATVESGGDRTTSARLDPAGKLLATGNRDGSVRLWDAASGAPLRSFAGHASTIGDVAFDPDGKRLVTAGWDRNARVFDVATGALLLELHLEESVLTAAFSDDGATIYASSSSTARTWNAKNGDLVASLHHSNHAGTAALVDRGRLLLLGGADGVIALCELGGRTLEQFEGGGATPYLVAASGDGRRIAGVDDEGVVRVWEAGAYRAPVALPGAVQSASFAEGGKLLMVSARWLQLVDAGSGRLLGNQPLGGPTTAAVSFGKDGVHVFDLDAGNALWNVAAGTLAPLASGTGLRVMAASPAGGLVAGTDLEDSWPEDRWRPTIIVAEAASGRRVQTIKSRLSLGRPSFTPDGKWLAMSGSGVLDVWEIASGARVASIDHHKTILDYDVSSARSMAVFVDSDGLAEIWDLRAGRLLHVLRGRPERLGAVANRADGTFVMSGSDDGTVTMWDTVAGQPLASRKLTGAAIRHIVFDVDGVRALAMTSSASWLIDVSPETRDADALARELAERSPFTFVHSGLRPMAPPTNLVAGAPLARRDVPNLACPPGSWPSGGLPPADLVAWCRLTDGEARGPLLRFWPSGVKQSEWQIEHDLPVGRQLLWDPAGRLAATLDFDGSRSTETRYHPNGAPASRLMRDRGMPTGEYRAWYPDGTLRELGRYSSTDDLTNLAAGMPDGLWTTFHPDGKKESEGLYLTRFGSRMAFYTGSTRAVGDWTYWDAAGRETRKALGCPGHTELYVESMPVKPRCR